MRPPGSNELLEAWERVRTRPPAERPLILLGTLDRDGEGEAWANRPIGQCNAQLLAHREQVFGPALNCLGVCPRCRTEVEFAVRTDEWPDPPDMVPTELSLDVDGVKLSFRLPNSSDLIAVSREADAATARRHLFALCLNSALQPDGSPLNAEEIPDELVEAAGGKMAEADPSADLSFALVCPSCGEQWEAPLDVASFFEQELGAWAKRLLREVHELASAYGWSEPECLALTPTRRQSYLELIRS